MTKVSLNETSFTILVPNKQLQQNSLDVYDRYAYVPSSRISRKPVRKLSSSRPSHAQATYTIA